MPFGFLQCDWDQFLPAIQEGLARRRGIGFFGCPGWEFNPNNHSGSAQCGALVQTFTGDVNFRLNQ